VSLGSAVSVDNSDYLAIVADNGTASFFAIGSITDEGTNQFSVGFSYWADAFPLAANYVAGGTYRGGVIILIGA
jgi:hypothetical protein